MGPAANENHGKQGTKSADRRFVLGIAAEFAVVIVIGLLIGRLLDVALTVLTQDFQPARSWDERAAMPKSGYAGWRDQGVNPAAVTPVSSRAVSPVKPPALNG